MICNLTWDLIDALDHKNIIIRGDEGLHISISANHVYVTDVDEKRGPGTEPDPLQLTIPET